MLFLIQFSIACSCLAVNQQQQEQFAEEGWNQVPTSIRKEVQDTFICCGFNTTSSDPSLSCDNVKVINTPSDSQRFLCNMRLFVRHSSPCAVRQTPRWTVIAHRVVRSWKKPLIMHLSFAAALDCSLASPR